MFNKAKQYAVESVTSGHPDKICDQIADAILDECLRQDKMSRVAVEVFGGHGLLVIGGEITTNAIVDYEKIAKDVYREIGYDDTLRVLVNVVTQSPDISQGVDTGGAGDQGMMYGFATNETKEFLPRAVVNVHALASLLQSARETEKLPWLMPDGKTQISINDGKISSVLISTQHKSGISQQEIRNNLVSKIIVPVIGDISDIEILTNPTGNFESGGFGADTGLTGRKLMVDTYCGLVPHGGGAFSGKDATKVDRSAAYMCRFAAKNIVARGDCNECLVSVAYAIGRAEPVMLSAIDEFGNDYSEILKKNFDFRPSAIIERLNLRSPIFQKTATYGHFGKEWFPWEQII
ncbi:MAG: methionine adenosyltransferase [Candidatus Jorgensenbacteria bacterium]|nr:methionine adenosyltransferase [Candidatus Jorgensenbacteria bacterium]